MVLIFNTSPAGCIIIIRTCNIHIASVKAFIRVLHLQGGVHYTIPSTAFGVAAVAAGLAALLLPETAGTTLPATVAEVERQAKKKKKKTPQN